MTILVVNNTFSNNFKYPHSRKLQNKLEALTHILLMEMVLPFKIWLLSLKDHREFEFFVLTREINKLYFFVIFCKRQRRITLSSRNKSDWIKSKRDIIYLPATPLKIFLSPISYFTYRELSSCFLSYQVIEAGLYFKKHKIVKDEDCL